MRRRIGIAGMILALCLAGCGENGEQTSLAVTQQEPGSGAMMEGEEEPESGEAKPDGGENSHMLIVYFSQSGNTRQIAEFIVQETGGDLFEIVTTEPYPDVLEELYERGQEELDANARPELAERVENIEDYDTIFLGYPNMEQGFDSVLCA